MGTAFSLCVIDAPSSAADSAEEDEPSAISTTPEDVAEADNGNTNSRAVVSVAADNDTEPLVATGNAPASITDGVKTGGSVKRSTAKIKDGNHCDKCGKKLGLTGGYACRCGGVFCALHRYSDRHDCTFDYRASGAEQIRRDNPVVTADKVRKL